MTVYLVALAMLCLVVSGVFLWFVRVIADLERKKK